MKRTLLTGLAAAALVANYAYAADLRVKAPPTTTARTGVRLDRLLHRRQHRLGSGRDECVV